MARRRPGPLLHVVSTLIAALVAATLMTSPGNSATASRAKPPKADLKITAGSVAVTSTRITGSLKVKNAGKKKAKRSTASLVLDGTQVQALPVGALKKGVSKVVTFSLPLSVGKHVVTACADARAKVKESKEKNNCRVLGRYSIQPSPTAPTDPIAYTPGTVFPVDAPGMDYSLHVPTTYAGSHQTPTGLVVFLGGCGSDAQSFGGVIKSSVPGLAAEDYIVLTAGTGPSLCWDTSLDRAKVLAAIADVKTHFNIAPKKVVIGGYSSGGFLAGATAFNNLTQFAGVVALCAPVYNGSIAQANAIGDAGWRINVVMRGHYNDGTVDISALQSSKATLEGADFPVAYSEVTGLDHAYVGSDFVWLFDQISPSWSAP